MNFSKAICLIIFICFLNTKVISNQRFICSRVDTREVVNFYISDSKIFLSGLSISGRYSILNKNLNGILAINMSSIGKDSGIEVIFLDLNKKSFTVKSSINNNNSKNNKFIEIKGNCK
tara:strand:+ start:169 stop:522 length:354 start_codon:yes stop_codon:yes gene_type:complete